KTRLLVAAVRETGTQPRPPLRHLTACRSSRPAALVSARGGPAQLFGRMLKLREGCEGLRELLVCGFHWGGATRSRPASSKTPGVRKSRPAIRRIHSGETTRPRASPAKTVIAEAMTSASDDPQKTAHFERCEAASDKAAICVLSPISAKKIVLKVV